MERHSFVYKNTTLSFQELLNLYKSFCIYYTNATLSFQELLNLYNSFCIYYRNLQKLTIEMYKAKDKICPTPFQEPFLTYKNSFNLRRK